MNEKEREETMEKITLWLNLFFHRWAVAGRPVWEFRVRYSNKHTCWLIELKEDDHCVWTPLTECSDQTRNEHLLLKFESYQLAFSEANRLGLGMAYEQAYYTKDKKPLHPAQTAIEHNVLATTPHALDFDLGGARGSQPMGSSFRGSAPVRSISSSKHAA